MLDLKVSVQGGVHFDLVKRVMRDVHRSGQQPDEIIQQVGVRGEIIQQVGYKVKPYRS